MVRKILSLAIAAAIGAAVAPAYSAPYVRNAAVGIVGAGATADPLVAVEANRSAIVNKLVANYSQILSAAGVDASSFRSALNGLRADQLLAASLVSSIEEVTAIVAQTPADGAALQQFYSVVPTTPTSMLDIPAASAYLVRSGDELAIVAASSLELGGTSKVVGYFAPGSVASAIAAPAMFDGPGTGANSWIGFTAGNNAASGVGSAVAAGTFNAATNQNAAVFAGQSNVASGISSLVIGGFDNRATAIDSLVGAGAGHRATGARSVVVGGGYNLASGQWSFIGGGGRQTANAAAAGGFTEDNIASGSFSVVTGGQANRATGAFATVPGGIANTAGGNASVAMGAGAGAAGFASFVFADNVFYNSNGDYTFNIRARNGVHIDASTRIIMGSQTRQNITLWGAANQYGIGVQAATQYFRSDANFAWFADGVHSDTTFDPGAGGTRVLTLAPDSTLTFGDPTTVQWGEFIKLNAFNDRAIGSQDNTLYFRSNAFCWFRGGVHSDSSCTAGAGGTVAMILNSGGLTVNGTFVSASDRNLKTSVQSVNAKSILAKVAALPISSWVYKEDAGTRHIGPMAQDFKELFDVGVDDKTISMVDADGIALAAIKGLIEEARERDALIAAQAAEIASLKSQMAKVAEAQDDLRVVKATLAELLRERAAAPVQVKLINR